MSLLIAASFLLERELYNIIKNLCLEHVCYSHCLKSTSKIWYFKKNICKVFFNFIFKICLYRDYHVLHILIFNL